LVGKKEQGHQKNLSTKKKRGMVHWAATKKGPHDERREEKKKGEGFFALPTGEGVIVLGKKKKFRTIFFK